MNEVRQGCRVCCIQPHPIPSYHLYSYTFEDAKRWRRVSRGAVSRTSTRNLSVPG